MSDRVNFETSILEYGEVNSGFAKVKISVMTHEQVANGTKFSKESIDKRKMGLNYLPVIGEYKEESKDFGTHGGKLEISDDGFNFVDTTRPYGVVIENSARWENVQMKNGDTVEYLVADAFLWIDRYKELECLYEGKLNNQSMEISVLEGSYNSETNVYDIKDFEFSALCILGTDVAPAFHEAKVMTQFESNTFKAQYNEMLSALDKYVKKYEEKEEDTVENEEQVEVEETVETQTSEVETQEEETEVVVDTQTEEVEEPTVEVEVETPVVEDTVEETETNDYTKELEELRSAYAKLEEEVISLREFKATTEKNDKLSVIDSFANKLNKEDVQSIIDNVDKYSKDEVETKCFAILGKKALDGKYSQEQAEQPRVSTQIQFENDDVPAWVKLVRK